MVGTVSGLPAQERATATLARERPADLARALDTGVLLANVAGALDRVSDEATDQADWARNAIEYGAPGPDRILAGIGSIRRALDLAESTLRFLEGDAA